MKILKRVQAQTEALPYQISDMIKEIQDTIYNISARYLKAKGWDLSDIADYFVVEVQEAQPGIIRAEIRGELSEDELFGLMQQLDRVIAVKFDEEAYFDAVTPGVAEAFIRTEVQACTQVTTSEEVTTPDNASTHLNYTTPEMKQLKRAISSIYVDSDEQFHELVDAILNEEPINLVPETKALKRAIDGMVVDSDEEKRNLIYNVAKDLGVIESSTQTKATSKNKYCIQFKIGDEVRFSHGGGQYSDEVATISGYDKDGFYKVTWEDGSTSEGLSDTQLIYEDEDEDDIELSTEIKAYTFDETEDGWGEDVEAVLSEVFSRTEDLMYEVRNTVRGANTDCETVEDLAEYIRRIASDFEEAADEIESL